MKGLFVVLLMFVVASPSLCAIVPKKPSLCARFNAGSCFNVVNYGATGDGHTDDSNAFLKAWKDVCGATQGNATLVIPKGKTFMLQPVLFQGPCNSAIIHIKFHGTIIAPKSIEAWKWSNSDDKDTWVKFSNINGLFINGGGLVDGNGAPWWKHDDQSNRPTALRFHDCGSLKLNMLTHINSPKNHISINSCNGVSVSKLHVIAPEESPNTDGIDISNSSNIAIKSSTFETGDDCVAINSGSSFINITNVKCGPGHGISVGSLGKNGDYARVEEVHVKNCTFKGTTNGARIKTWTGGSGYAKKITFEDIKLIGVKNPLIINQHYNGLYDSEREAVKVSDVSYRNVRGTSISKIAIQLNCDGVIGCTNIILHNVNITGVDGEKTNAMCNNVQGICSSCHPNVPCLSQINMS